MLLELRDLVLNIQSPLVFLYDFLLQFLPLCESFKLSILLLFLLGLEFRVFNYLLDLSVLEVFLIFLLLPDFLLLSLFLLHSLSFFARFLSLGFLLAPEPVSQLIFELHVLLLQKLVVLLALLSSHGFLFLVIFISLSCGHNVLCFFLSVLNFLPCL